MSPHTLLLALLIAFSSPSRSAQPRFVDRVQSELVRALDTEARPMKGVPLSVTRFSPHLTRVGAVRTAYAGSNTRMWSACWWLWLLSGLELC